MNGLYIPFHGTKLIAVEVDGEIFVAMRPIVLDMGLSWARQAQKLQKNFKKYGCTHMTTPTPSGCLKIKIRLSRIRW